MIMSHCSCLHMRKNTFYNGLKLKKLCKHCDHYFVLVTFLCSFPVVSLIYCICIPGIVHACICTSDTVIFTNVYSLCTTDILSVTMANSKYWNMYVRKYLLIFILHVMNLLIVQA